MELESIRREYKYAELSKASVGKDPFILFEKWLKEALQVQPNDATAVALNTIGSDGFPHSRIILLKNFSGDGFVFFTNYDSQKGKDIEQNPHVGLHFFWSELDRQIRINGLVEKTDASSSDEYFHSRPFESQVAAAISDQSQEVPDRKYLEDKFEKLKSDLGENDPERPENWGGYLVKPIRFEFWQGRESRLHDRIVFEKKAENWEIKRLAP